MRILILHRIPYRYLKYHLGVNHDVHDVTYVGMAAALETVPSELRASRVARPGVGSVADEVVALMRDQPAFDRVISMSEHELLEAARVREALGVPGPSCRQIELVRDKVKMKAAVARAGLRVPRFHRLSDREGLAAGAVWVGKTILKPVDGASSNGVESFATYEEAVAASAGKDPAGFELEEFVTGPIFHVDGVMADGAKVAMVTSRYVGTCLGYLGGAPLGSVQQAHDPVLEAWAARCLAAVELRDGAFHLEGILSADGPVFLEVAARVGGADVVDTFEMATGIHMPSTELAIAVGAETPAQARARVTGAAARFGWFAFPGHHLPAGTCRVAGAEPFRGHPLVRRWNELPSDRTLSKTVTYVEVPITGVVGGDAVSELEALLRDMFATVRVEPIAA